MLTFCFLVVFLCVLGVFFVCVCVFAGVFVCVFAGVLVCVFVCIFVCVCARKEIIQQRKEEGKMQGIIQQ